VKRDIEVWKHGRVSGAGSELLMEVGPGRGMNSAGSAVDFVSSVAPGGVERDR
jgi:hypothetical protein